MTFSDIAAKYKVRPDSIRAAALKRLAAGKPVSLSGQLKAAIPYLRRRGKAVGYHIDCFETGKYLLTAAKRKAA